MPDFPCRIISDKGTDKIFDSYRKRYVTLTPEEWVRQHFCHYLTDCLHYPAGRLCNEYRVRVNGMPQRADTVVFDARMRPLAVVEYKAPAVTIDRAVFDQVVRYNSVLRAPYVFVSNGLTNYACHICYETGEVTFLREIPPFDALSGAAY